MLVLTRRKGEGIFVSLDPEVRKCLEGILKKAHREDAIPIIHSEIKIVVTEIQSDGNQVKFGLEAPREFIIFRSELLKNCKKPESEPLPNPKDETLCLWQRFISVVKLKN